MGVHLTALMAGMADSTCCGNTCFPTGQLILAAALGCGKDFSSFQLLISRQISWENVPLKINMH